MNINKKLIIVIAALICISALIVGISIRLNINRLGEETNNPHLIGCWSAKCVLSYDSKTGKPLEYVDVVINIGEDGTVFGNVGNARLIDCQLQKNRTVLEKSLNIKTDYIILGGVLDGPIKDGDNLGKRDITIPFNIKDETLVGTLFHVEAMKYPDPIVSKLELKKNEGAIDK